MRHVCKIYMLQNPLQMGASDFLIPLSLQSNVVDQIYRTMKSVKSMYLSFKYPRFTL